MKVRGTKYVWSADHHFLMIFYARKEWARTLMDNHPNGPKWKSPRVRPFGTWLYVLDTLEPNTHIRVTRKEWAQEAAYAKWDRRHYET